VGACAACPNGLPTTMYVTLVVMSGNIRCIDGASVKVTYGGNGLWQGKTGFIFNCCCSTGLCPTEVQATVKCLSTGIAVFANVVQAVPSADPNCHGLAIGGGLFLCGCARNPIWGDLTTAYPVNCTTFTARTGALTYTQAHDIHEDCLTCWDGTDQVELFLSP
jgi:hypothetical protein